MSKSQKTLALAAMAPHLLGEKSEATVAQAVRGNRSGAVTPGSVWELPSQVIGGVWYRSLTFTSFAAYKTAKTARARMARNDAKASVNRENGISRPVCTGGKSYGPKRHSGGGVARLVNVGVAIAPTAETPKVKAKPATKIARRVREVAAHVAWCLAEAASAAKATAKVARVAAKAAKKEKAKGEKIAKKVMHRQAVLAKARKEGAACGELLRAWNRA